MRNPFRRLSSSQRCLPRFEALESREVPATFVVDNLADSGTGSLRQAVLDANASSGADLITFQSGLTGTIVLSGGDIDILEAATIQGPGADVLRVDGGGTSRIFYLSHSGTTTTIISGLTLQNGMSGGQGGALYLDSGDLVIDSCVISNNTVTGGIGGGGISIGGSPSDDLTIRDSLISGNTTTSATASGGGLYFRGGNLLIENSTITGNTAAENGGGVMMRSATNIVIRNSTIAFNTATNLGGGLYLSNSGTSTPTTIISTIISNNTANTGSNEDVFVQTTNILNVENSLILAPVGGLGINGTNLNNVLGVDPGLMPLSNNGGPTQTHAITATSAAFNAGSNPDSLPFDQRGSGFARTVDGATDIGAFEIQNVSPPPPPAPPAPPTPPSPIAITNFTAVGSGAGTIVEVKVYGSDGSLARTLSPFEASFTGGATVVTGDLTGDGIDDIVVGAAQGGGPRIVVFDGATGNVLRDFFAFENFERGGVFVAIGDADGDGDNDIIAGAGVGGGPRVQAFDFATLSSVQSYFAFSDTAFRGGVTVAFDGGRIVAGRGPSGPPEVSVYDVASRSFAIFLAYELEYTGGVNVTANNGLIVTGPMSASPRARIFTASGQLAGFPDILAFGGSGNGVRVGVGGTSAAPTLLLGFGGGANGTEVDVEEFLGDGTQLPGFNAFDPNPPGGVFVG